MIRIGILGTGRIAHKMAKTLLLMKLEGRTGFEITAVASRSLEMAKIFQTDYHIKYAFGSYEELVQAEEVDLIYISSPHSCHFEHTKLCIQYEKHVVCEKPMVVNAQQAEYLFQLADEKKVFVMEAMWTRCLPIRKMIYDKVWSGIVGKPRMVTANLGYAVTHKKRLFDLQLAGGALLEVGVYPINFVDMIFDDLKILSASCIKNEDGIDMTETFTFSLAENVLAVLSASIVSNFDRGGNIFCTEGYIHIENINNPVQIQVYNSNYELIDITHAPKQITGLEYEIEECVSCINSGKCESKLMSHRDTIRMLKIMDELRKNIGVVYPFESSVCN